jgi:hypothetical protein
VSVTADTLRRMADLRAAVGAEADTAVRGLTAAWVDGWAGLTVRWRAALADVLALQAQLQRWPSPWQLSRLERVQRAMQSTEHTLTALGGQATAGITTAAGNATDLTVASEPHILASQLPAALATAAAVAFAAKVTGNSLATTRQRIVRQIARYTAPIAANGRDAVQRQLLGGRQAPTVHGLLANIGSAFHSALGSAIDTARVETVDAYRDTARLVQVANADVLAGWSWHCRCTPTSCASCWAMDGTQYPADVEGPLDHVGGRCMRLPLLRSWRRLGYTEDEPPSVIRPARDLFDELPEADQIRILGPARHALLVSGDIQWADLATRRENGRWRPAYAPTPVKDLRPFARTT